MYQRVLKIFIVETLVEREILHREAEEMMTPVGLNPAYNLITTGQKTYILSPCKRWWRY